MLDKMTLSENRWFCFSRRRALVWTVHLLLSVSLVSLVTFASHVSSCVFSRLFHDVDGLFLDNFIEHVHTKKHRRKIWAMETVHTIYRHWISLITVNYISQGGYVFHHVGWFVSWFDSNITWKVLNGLPLNLDGGCASPI